MQDAQNSQNVKVDRLLSPEDAALFLGPEGKPVPLATLQWWRYKRRGPGFVKIGRHIYYRESALFDFIRRSEVAVREAGHA